MHILIMKNREKNREVTYLKDETQKRLIDFVKVHPTLTSKSRVIELALDFYLEMAQRHGLDDRWQPKIQDSHPADKEIPSFKSSRRHSRSA